jgi:cytochrome d ubiquinol oxidase subunit I
MVLHARVQFAFSIAFHTLFPAFAIGLASYLAALEALWLRTRRRVCRQLYDFWLKLFARSLPQGFLLAGILVPLPSRPAYAAYAYRVFRRKVEGGGGYH